MQVWLIDSNENRFSKLAFFLCDCNAKCDHLKSPHCAIHIFFFLNGIFDCLIRSLNISSSMVFAMIWKNHKNIFSIKNLNWKFKKKFVHLSKIDQLSSMHAKQMSITFVFLFFELKEFDLHVMNEIGKKKCAQRYK